MLKWFKRQIATLSLAIANVEKNALSQIGKDLDLNENQEQSHKKGTLEHSLIQGEVTQEVRDLRWRMYKMLEASEGLTTTITGYDEDGMPITITSKKTNEHEKRKLSKVKLDEYDNYELEIVVNNEPINLSTTDILSNNNLTGYTDEIILEQKYYTDNNSTSIAEINFDDYNSSVKPEYPILITRDFKPTFEIEKYTKKLNVRKINDNEKLLEFYISKYPDEFDRKTRLLISEIKRAINNPKSTNILDINKVNFISYKTLGVKDFHIYEYNINNFDKIIEFDGFYVIKFKCYVITNGEYLLEKYREEELEFKYENKVKKDY